MSDSMHKMRGLLRCGAPVRAMRTAPAPDDAFVAAYHANQVPDDWVSQDDPDNAQLSADVLQYSRTRDRLERSSSALDRIYNDVVHPQRKKNMQWMVLDAILLHVLTPIRRTLQQINDARSFWRTNNRIPSVNRRFYQDQGRLEARCELLSGLLRDAHATLQDLYVGIGIYAAENQIVSLNDYRQRTEEYIWDQFCARIRELREVDEFLARTRELPS